jgi:hypothetical protein
MCVEPESTDDLAPMDEFERELCWAMAWRPAPPGLKRAVMERLRQERAERGRHARVIWFERLAASLVLAGVVGAAVLGRNAMERRKGEEAKQQLFTALRITNHALQEMNVQLRDRDSNSQ